MKVLIGSEGRFDFGAPLILSDEQRAKLLDFLRKEFEPVEIEFSDEFREERLGDKPRFMAEWSKKEYAMLLLPRGNEYLEDKMGRTWMSIVMKRKDFLPDFETWLRANSLSISQANEELIGKYLDELGIEKKKRAQARSKYGSIYVCPECWLEYLPSRFSNPDIVSPGTCDYEGGKLVERKKLKEKIEEETRVGKLKEIHLP